MPGYGPRPLPDQAKQVPAANRALVLLRDGGSDRYDGRGVGEHINVHHRQLRSQGPLHDVGNLVSLYGSGTTGNHGIMHARPEFARRLGFIVPSHVEDPADVPIRLASRYGVKRWTLLDHLGYETHLDPRDVVERMRALGIWGPNENWL